MRLSQILTPRHWRRLAQPLALTGLIIGATVFPNAWAQAPYAIPAHARSGRISAQQFPAVSIDGKDYRLAPGARIYNTNHLTITPNQLPKDAPVKFLLNSDGQIQTVWLLKAQGSQ